MNDVLMAKQGIAFQDNYKWRSWLQAKGPEALSLPLKNAACGGAPTSALVEKQ